MTQNKNKIIVAIDGPAGAGKSTVARALARRLNFFYLDTGAMYRALTLKAIQNRIRLDDEDELVGLAGQTKIELKDDKELKVLLDGKDVSKEIRSAEVTNKTFHAAQAPRVRDLMVQWQREYGRSQNIVIEGRDITTVVFPKADFKFYLDADFEERCRRRILELRQQGKQIDEQALKEDLSRRDQRDLTRKAGPLRKTADAVFIDSTSLTVDQVVEKMFSLIQDRAKADALFS